MHKKGEFVKFKNYERKIKSPFIIYANFESILMTEKIEKQNLIQTDIKNILLAVMDKNQFVPILSLMRLLKHSQEKMQFTISLIA